MAATAGRARAMVMCGVLVPRGRLRRAVDLDQDKPRRIIRLLDDTSNPRDAGFLDAEARVLDGWLPGTSAMKFRLHVHLNVTTSMGPP